MARLDYVEPAGEVTERIKARRGGELIALDKMLLHAPAIAAGWSTLLGAIRTGSSLPADVRELVILRIAYINQAGFEWHDHEKIGRDSGLDDQQINALREGTKNGLSGVQWLALQYCDEMTRNVKVSDELFAKLKAALRAKELVELTATVGAYNMVSRFLVALNVAEQNGVAF